MLIRTSGRSFPQRRRLPAGQPVVIAVDAQAMARDGITLYLLENGVWLCEHAAPAYFVTEG